MRRVIEKMMTADFLDFALAILNHPHSDDVNAMYQEVINLVSKILTVVIFIVFYKSSFHFLLNKHENTTHIFFKAWYVLNPILVFFYFFGPTWHR